MPTAMRRCLGCKTLILGGRSRCATCAKTLRATRVQHPGGRSWQKVRDAILERDDRICYLCGGSGATSADHIVPVVRGGTDEPENLRAAHVSCNSRRGAGR